MRVRRYHTRDADAHRGLGGDSEARLRGGGLGSLLGAKVERLLEEPFDPLQHFWDIDAGRIANA